MKQSINIQDAFLNQIRKESVPVTIFLVNGFQIRGVIRGFDNFTIIIESEGKQQMVYKHAISTFTPVRYVSLMANEEEKVAE
ncbi:RNA chaperone Hfq [Hazenella sp. IB182357]|uniref:RNA-binding protein Hfq n=1 Tax=Polycladospora coralii TaxID=2771432 RepID=A0A926NAI1_9BACL|nr:RNA chaperone Hfq [Polycladospora coralii]MBD1372937.1 RNA chaperone Hfq [Polycladospora coralii]MBS7531006.1 RNA chaperone Hfq [Polycladospora coralii]